MPTDVPLGKPGQYPNFSVLITDLLKLGTAEFVQFEGLGLISHFEQGAAPIRPRQCRHPLVSEVKERGPHLPVKRDGAIVIAKVGVDTGEGLFGRRDRKSTRLN